MSFYDWNFECKTLAGKGRIKKIKLLQFCNVVGHPCPSTLKHCNQNTCRLELFIIDHLVLNEEEVAQHV